MQASLDRRDVLGWLGAGTSCLVLAACGTDPAAARSFRVSKTDRQWRDQLTAAQYRVLRQEATERPFSSPLDREKRVGVFHCAGCNNAVYASKHKFDSGTGWPSFWQAFDKGAVGRSTDYRIGYPRTEVHCADCGGHLGHIFDDGPRPTGKRHCINGVALKFRPA